jgi:hypothetical protein
MNTETTPTAAERHDMTMRAIYGPFTPGSNARALRTENAQRGYRTCWNCLGAFRPHRFVGTDGRLHRLGRGRWYCSAACARSARAAEPLMSDFELDGDTFTIDLRGCRGCAA